MELEKFVLMLAEAYGKQISKNRVMIYKMSLEKISFNKKIFKKILDTYNFFPSVKEILDISLEKNKKADPSFLVDEILSAVYSGENVYLKLGKEKYDLAKKIGIDFYLLRSGAQDPKFLKKTWCERARNIIENENQNQLESIKNQWNMKKLGSLID